MSPARSVEEVANVVTHGIGAVAAQLEPRAVRHLFALAGSVCHAVAVSTTL